jgi:N-acetylmuramoyl-L-alanine amidase
MRYRSLNAVLILPFILLFASLSSAAQTLELIMGGERILIPLTSIEGHQYLRLDQVCRILQLKCQSISERRLQIFLPKSSCILKQRSPVLTLGEESVALSAPPLTLKSEWVIPVDLFSLLLNELHGENVTWDKDSSRIRVRTSTQSVLLLRHHSYPDHTRIVVELAQPLNHTWKEESNRVILRLEGGVLSPSLKGQTIGDGLIKDIRVKQNSGGSEIALSGLGPHREVKVFALNNPHRIVIDVYRDQMDRSEPQALRKEKRDVSLASLHSPKIRLIIDPGHGGKDSGAVGPMGLKEKDVVLDIGLRLKDMVEQRLGMEAVMTRNEDTFVPLRDRAVVANSLKGDFFISIHANASLHGKAEGFETFFLSQEASDSEAREAAMRENNVIDLEKVSPEASANLKATLWDMAQNEYITESSRLAEIIQGELDKTQQVANRGIKTAPFYVLMGVAMPAVLVEIAFISNREGERRLNDDVYRQSLCEALLRAISEYKGHFEKKMGMAIDTRSS